MTMAGSSEISGSSGTTPKVKRVLNYYSNVVIPDDQIVNLRSIREGMKNQMLPNLKNKSNSLTAK